MVVAVPRRGPARRGRRGQAEVIGGLIVLTLIFMFAVPILLNSYYTAQKATEAAKAASTRKMTAFNERLSIQGISPDNQLALRAGWIPGVFINNTGTVDVVLDKLYLIDIVNNTIYAVLDLRYARPTTTDLIKDMVMDVDPTGGFNPPPPAGQPIVLKPGQNLMIAFNDSLLPIASQLVVKVESASGVIHPLGGEGGAANKLYPGRPGTGAAAEGAWRGIFAPQSGFSLRGYNDLINSGIAYAWRPPLYVYPDRDSDWNYEPEDLDYYTSFIYEDPKYPGLYYLYITVAEPTYLIVWIDRWTRSVCAVWTGQTIVLRGYVGTYDTGGDSYGTYFNGYAFEVRVYSDTGYLRCQIGPYDPVRLTDDSIIASDFDGNGVEEVTFYSYLNGPNYPPSDRDNIDADYSPVYSAFNDYDEDRDALVWTYMVARDISGIDYVRITVKVNYYWTTTFSSWTGCPDWNYRHLKIFAVVVWKYNPDTGSWEVYQYQNFGYTTEKPVQFQPSVTFPLDRNGTYRIGVMFFDNYRDWDGYGYICFTDFTMTLEHIIVEYGIVNPLFRESPPLYIVAIPDPDLISGIGEQDYANARNISDIDEAKVKAQAELLQYILEELNYAGVAGYTIINDTDMLYDLLFSTNQPKYAVVLWLQGSVTVDDVLGSYGIDDYDVKNSISSNHWVWIWPSGEPFGDATRASIYFGWGNVIINGPDQYNLTITDAGIKARREFYAYYLFNRVLFNYTSYNTTTGCLIPPSAFYADNATAPSYYGTVAYWVDCDEGTGAVMLNPVHIDWDVTGDGALPQTVAQQIVYAMLYTWEAVRYG